MSLQSFLKENVFDKKKWMIIYGRLTYSHEKINIYILGFSCIGTFWVCWAMYSKMIFIFEDGDIQPLVLS